MKFCLDKSSRLLKSENFRKLAKYGKKCEGRYLKIQILDGQEKRKLGLTVSKRFGKAVQRNRFKRIVREAFRLNQHLLPTNIIINVSPKEAPSHLHDVEKELHSLIETDLALPDSRL